MGPSLFWIILWPVIDYITAPNNQYSGVLKWDSNSGNYPCSIALGCIRVHVDILHTHVRVYVRGSGFGI